METFWTVASGTLVYVIGQGVQRFVLAPIEEQRRVIGEIDNERIFLANLVAHLPYHEPPDDLKLVQPDDPVEASRRVRKLAARLRSTVWTIPF